MIKASPAGFFGLFMLLGGSMAIGQTVDKPAVSRPTAEEKAVQAFGDDNRTCREWSDGCVLCVRAEGGVSACSTPGIACLAHGVSCTAADPTPAPAK